MLDIDSSDHPFECANVLPAQFFADRHKFGEPIERLMFAVLNDAIRCYQTNFGVQRLRARRSKWWSDEKFDLLLTPTIAAKRRSRRCY